MSRIFFSLFFLVRTFFYDIRRIFLCRVSQSSYERIVLIRGPTLNVSLVVAEEWMLHLVFSDDINAVSNHFIGLFKIIRYTEMSATSLVTQRKIVVMRKNNQYNSGKFLKPSHLAHKLRKARKQFYVKTSTRGKRVQ